MDHAPPAACGLCSGNGCPDCDPRIAAAVEDYDSGAGWDRVADAMDRHGAGAVLANPELVEDAPQAVSP